MSLNHKDFPLIIEDLWDKGLSLKAIDQAKPILDQVLQGLTQGEITVVRRQGWSINTWVKKAILLMFRFFPNRIKGLDFHKGLEGNDQGQWADKIPLRGLEEGQKLRIVPGAWVRQGAFLADSTVIMPSFINIGAYIDERTMIDSGTSVGSCAFIGKSCHISSTVTIGGVLEPLQASPVIIEDHCFIGAGSQVLEGIHIGEGSVLGAGVILTSSTKIVHRDTGTISYGYVPSGSVVVPGSYGEGTVRVQCAVIIKNVDQLTRSKTSLTDLLRSE